jgi:hypothetical protein
VGASRRRYLYQAALRDQTTERLGLDWQPVVNGTADLAGVPRAVIEHFSQRRAEILEHMARRGEHSARAAQVATLQTCRAKSHDVPIGRLREQWQARAAEHGFGRRQLERVLRDGRWAQRAERDPERVAVELESPEGLTRSSSTFTRRDVLRPSPTSREETPTCTPSARCCRSPSRTCR